MSDANPKVVALVERELKKNPDAKSVELQEKAEKVDKSVANLTGRQFHAQYALQVRRRLSGETRSEASGRPGRGRGREHPVQSLLAGGLEEARVALDNAVEAAFQRALEADDMVRIKRLFSVLERHKRDLEEV